MVDASSNIWRSGVDTVVDILVDIYCHLVDEAALRGAWVGAGRDAGGGGAGPRPRVGAGRHRGAGHHVARAALELHDVPHPEHLQVILNERGKYWSVV